MSTDRPIIVGSGIAGLWTAWRLASEGRASVLLTKGALTDSATAWAQGGIAVAMGPGDSAPLHAADTLAAGDGLSDPEAVRILTREGPERIRELLLLGAVFDRGEDGALRFALEAAHSRPRVIHAGGDRTGARLVTCLTQILRDNPLVQILEHTEVKQLLVREGRVVGVAALRPGGPTFPLRAPEVVLATGGVGQLYAKTTNPTIATADGWALSYRAGAALRDLEFLQFHPTALNLPGVNPAPLISEAVRGAGATLLDSSGRRFALAADPRGELASRDILARAVAAADAAGGVWLDARQVPDFATRFPAITKMLARHGLDPRGDLLPVAPALHYAMGGIQTDLDGRSTRRGLWAVGEVASTGVHGANRLASNSLLEGLVFADRAGRALAQAEPEPEPADVPFTAEIETGADQTARCASLREEMRSIMTADVGVQRTEVSLLHAQRELARLARAVPSDAWRTANQILVARLITRAARRRRESRGGHRRLDYPSKARRHQTNTGTPSRMIPTSIENATGFETR